MMRIDLSGQQFYFPQICACCHAPAQRSLIVHATQVVGRGRLQTTASRAWNIPYCRACIRHVHFWEGALYVVLFGVSMSLVSAALLFVFGAPAPIALTTAVGGGVASFGAFLFLTRMAWRCRVHSCTGITRAVQYLGWEGSHHAFEVRSWRFAYDFMSLNERKLINLSPHALHWLKRSGIDQQKAPQAAKRYLPRSHR